MKYIEFDFSIDPFVPYQRDILNDLLSDAGFDSFLDTETGSKAYIPKEKFDNGQLSDVFKSPLLTSTITYKEREIEDKDWNEEWERNYFKPLLIADQCLVRSSHHPENTRKIDYEIVIDPKMSFGTGHHQTTSLMIEFILPLDLKEKKVLDVGCGTGILSILSAKKGAAFVDAIDTDEWAVRNAIENAKINDVTIDIHQGDVSTVIAEKYDVVLANINRNILLEEMWEYGTIINPNGLLIISGFYLNDLPILEEKAAEYDLKHRETKTKDDWAAAIFIKQ